MINLKTEEFVLEMTTLQSLQQLIQWVGDFVLYLLASLPNQVSTRGGAGLCQPSPGQTNTREKSRDTKRSFLCQSGHRQWCEWQLHLETWAQRLQDMFKLSMNCCTALGSPARSGSRRRAVLEKSCVERSRGSGRLCESRCACESQSQRVFPSRARRCGQDTASCGTAHPWACSGS